MLLPLEADVEDDEQIFSDEIIAAVDSGRKIDAIKRLREETGLGLKEAKDLVDGAPNPVKEGVPKEEAESIKAKLEEAGAEVELT